MSEPASGSVSIGESVTGDDASSGASLYQFRPTFFGRIPERRPIFCVDTSGSMYYCLDAVKGHIIDVLRNLAYQSITDENPVMFNVIEFSSDISQFSEKMVPCTPDSVSVASEWIGALKPRTGTNTMDALLRAFHTEQPGCDAVYLITDSVPDRNITQVIDEVLLAAHDRPIHSFYIQCGAPDNSCIEFLKELSMETYGSLHVVLVTNHGLVDRVTPIYRAEMAAERIIRTNEGKVYPLNHKLCSVTTSLNTIHEPPQLYSYIPPAIPVATYLPPFSVDTPPHPFCLYPWPYRYYHHFVEPWGPSAGWARYRPAKAWLKHANEFMNNSRTLTPGAGALLIDTKVLARRSTDGYFYKGTARNQILANKFLVEFGPCKHGRYIDTEYQETFVHDIVSLVDAERHPVLVDDRVLAPWEPEGERYAPGVVIDGQEKRMAEGEEEDRQLVVTFFNGKTMTIARNKALWIPSDLHQRISFELKLPTQVRKEASQRDYYPEVAPPGFPSSGPVSFPREFDRHPPPPWISSSDSVVMSNGYHHQRSGSYENGFGIPYGPRTREHPSRVAETQFVPGTSLTQFELSKRVSEQIAQNSTLLQDMKIRDDGYVDGRGSPDRRCVSCGRSSPSREHHGSNGRHDSSKHFHDEGEFRKSVSFADDYLPRIERDDGRIETGSLTDYSDDSEYDYDSQNEKEVSGGQVHRRRLRRSRSTGNIPWKYWSKEPSPSVTDPLHYGRYRKGPFRDYHVDKPAFLLRDATKNSYGGVNCTSPMFRAVDSYAPYKHQATVADCLNAPRPLQPRPPRQAPGRELSAIIGDHLLPKEIIADARRDLRQSQVLQREISHQRRVAEAAGRESQRMEARRQAKTGQLIRDDQRHTDNMEKIERKLAEKRITREQVSQRYDSSASESKSKEEMRIAAKREAREARVLKAEQEKHDNDIKWSQRQATKELENTKRMAAHAEKLVEADRQQTAAMSRRQQTTAQQTRHFRQKETAAQKQKELNSHIKDQQMAIYRAKVLP